MHTNKNVTAAGRTQAEIEAAAGGFTDEQNARLDELLDQDTLTDADKAEVKSLRLAYAAARNASR